MIIEGNKITADEGKVLRRKANKEVVGETYYLGYIYYDGEKRLPAPYLEVPEDFEELTPEEIQREKEAMYPSLVEQYIRERYTVSDELAIQRQRETKQEAFDEYFAFCEDCKRRAREELGL